MIPVAAGSFPAAPGGRPAFWAATGRSGGSSAPPFASLNLASHVGDDESCVRANLATLAESVGLRQVDLVRLEAEHGGRVSVITSATSTAPGDGMVTAVRGIGLVALAADCVPIALASTAGVPVVGVAHCGWKGLGAGIVTATVRAMEELGGLRVKAVLGPSICAGCYPVPRERIALLRQEVGTAVFEAACAIDGAIGVADGVMAELGSLGVMAVRRPECTAEVPGLFSYRRDGRTGRQGMIVGL